jgi:hypothetical protein
MLSFYLAFLYADKPYYNTERILCMSKFLYDVQQENRLEQKGLLRRFSIICYGHQESREDMRSEKTKIFQKLKNKKESKEYEEWFLNYKPKTKTTIKTKKDQTKKDQTKKDQTKKDKTKKDKAKSKTKKNTSTSTTTTSITSSNSSLNT